MDYFGLWLSGDFGHGHSKAKPQCSTYGSPMLSSSEEFDVELVEVWGVGAPFSPDDEVRARNVSEYVPIIVYAHLLLFVRRMRKSRSVFLIVTRQLPPCWKWQAENFTVKS